MNLTILGIRHHGVGSARYVREALQTIQPDLVLIEGPPELDAVLPGLASAELKPPVAILAYNPDDPKQAVYYPFAEFSPEWQAMQYGVERAVPVRMIDLPLRHSFGMDRANEATAAPAGIQPDPSASENPDQGIKQTTQADSPPTTDTTTAAPELSASNDPLLPLALAGGFDDSEAWWEQHIEQRYRSGSALGHFAAVLDAMTALRESTDRAPTARDAENELREAYMRQLIRQVRTEGFQRVAVVCGAWHAPALVDIDRTKNEDTKCLKGLPKTNVQATWIPWTYDRLGWRSGYGAGITSPGWYDHCWHNPGDIGVRWLTHVARLFRKNKMDTSAAHIIEACRLAESLAALRGLPRPGLWELNEATQTVLCFGDSILLKLVEEELIVGKKMGSVPVDSPKLPLQADFETLAKKLRLPQTAERTDYALDLRKELDLGRSRFLHRLQVLGVDWGKRGASARAKGTFREVWTLVWAPELVLQLIEKGIYGNTVDAAATAFLLDKSQKTTRIGGLAELMQQAIPAELYGAIEQLLARISELAAVSADVLELMAAFTPLVEVSRYGNVRKTDLVVINQLVEGLIIRVCIGLPNACNGLDDESSAAMFTQIRLVNDAIRLLENDDLTIAWHTTLRQLADKSGVNPLITGCVSRLLFDSRQVSEPEMATAFGLALSGGNEPAYSAGWLEGFLMGSGMILVYDHTLWNLLYKWVAELASDQFTELLPILRRTFARFDPSQRRQLGAKAKQGVVAGPVRTAVADVDFNVEQARQVLAVVRELLY